MKYKCIIFDCDGILVDSEAISARVFHEMLLELGYNLDFETILNQITGTSMKENLSFFTKRIGHDLPPDFEQEFRKKSYEAFKTDLKPVEGVHDLLNKIKVPVGVASSGPVQKIKQNLTSANLFEKFENYVFSSYDIGSWKPEPDIYLHAAKQMGFTPNECAVIEDSLVGVKAAIKGGFTVYVLSNLKLNDTFESLGATVFSDMNELGNLLNLQ
jgi:HAD superfamily hydrolase (TIGR01509 family)